MEETFRAVYAAAYNDVLRFIQRRVDVSHAEDIAAEVFLVAWRRVDELPRVLDEQRAWLFGVARKTLANSLRSDQRREGLRVRIALHRSHRPTDNTSGVAVANVDVVRAWRRLTASEQEALALTTWDGLTSAQAAGLGHQRNGLPDPAFPCSAGFARLPRRQRCDFGNPLSTAHEGTSS